MEKLTYYQKNRQKVLNYQSHYYQKNKDKINKYSNTYYIINKNKITEKRKIVQSLKPKKIKNNPQVFLMLKYGMEVSVCVTVLNEEKTISDLIMGLMTQSKKPNEIVIVDGGSTDRTVKIVKHYQLKYEGIRLIIKKVSRAFGRNISVTASKNDIVATTDAGCVPKEDWLEKLTEPFKNSNTEVVAGFYDMVAVSSFQKALSIFMGVSPRNFTSNFLPSARSMAFNKLTFEKMSGFPVLMQDTAEDTMFVANLVRQGTKIVRVKNARVEWKLPETMMEAARKFYTYAVGDARSGIWVHPLTGIWSHNFKAATIILRYLFALILLLLSSSSIIWLLTFTAVVALYSARSFMKVYIITKKIKPGLWGILLQFVSDIAVMSGLLRGLLT